MNTVYLGLGSYACDLIVFMLYFFSGLLLLCLSRALILEYKQKYDNPKTDSIKKIGILKDIHEYQMDAFQYWKDDIQSKPLNDKMGYEACSLHDEMITVLTYISNYS